MNAPSQQLSIISTYAASRHMSAGVERISAVGSCALTYAVVATLVELSAVAGVGTVGDTGKSTVPVAREMVSA